MRKLITLSLFPLMFIGCASQSKTIEYVPTYKYLTSCGPSPSRPKLLGVSTNKRTSTADNLYRLDKDFDNMTSHMIILEGIIKCYEGQIDPSIKGE